MLRKARSRAHRMADARISIGAAAAVIVSAAPDASAHSASRARVIIGPRFERQTALAATLPTGTRRAAKWRRKLLRSSAPLEAKGVVCRQLPISGSSRWKSVPREMLRHMDTTAMSRYALHGLQ